MTSPHASAPPVELLAGAIERLLRRSLLLMSARDDATVQDRLDFAELADAVGAREMGSLVRATTMLRQGFAPDATDISELPQVSIERAIVEFREVTRYAAAEVPKGADAAATVDAAAACLALGGLLASTPGDTVEGELSGLLAGLRMLADSSPINPCARVDAPIAELVSAFVEDELRGFLRRNYDLAFAPYGSARLLHGAARLAPGALGPYFSRLGNVMRSSDDILGLIALAADGDAEAMVERWVVPLVGYLPEHMLIALADDLADLGLTEPLWGLLAATARQTDRLALLRCVRDAGLDLSNAKLALGAQEAVAAAARHDTIEWRILAMVRATAGDIDGAGAALSYALRLAPGDPETRRRLAALNEGDIAALALTSGFATPLHRQRIRFARRAA